MENLIVEVTTTTSSNCGPLSLHQVRLRENVDVVFNLKVGWLRLDLHMLFLKQFN